MFYAPLYNNHKLLIRFVFDRDGVENVEMFLLFYAISGNFTRGIFLKKIKLDL